MKQQLKKAWQWLCKQREPAPVVVVRDGYAQYVAYVFRIKREDKPSLWFCMEVLPDNSGYSKLKRICK